MSGEIRRSDAYLGAWVRPGEVERAADESPVERFRRWWRSRFRYAGSRAVPFRDDEVIDDVSIVLVGRTRLPRRFRPG